MHPSLPRAAFCVICFRLRQIEFTVQRENGLFHILFHDKEIFDSDEPCATAITFRFSCPIVMKVRPGMPTVTRIFSTTTSTIAMKGSSEICSTLWWARSCANCSRNASTVRLASAEATIKQMSFCDDDCEISRTLARTFAVVENVRPTTSESQQFRAHRAR